MRMRTHSHSELETYLAHPEADHRGAAVVIGGPLAGIIAGCAMGSLAMVLSVFGGRGFWTPMYNIAVPFVGSAPMHASMRAAESGSQYFALRPFLAGACTLLVVAAVFGFVYALFAAAAWLRAIGSVWTGILYGVAVMAGMSFFVLPFGAAYLGAGPELRDMPSTFGTAGWTAVHVAYGLVLGLMWALVRPRPHVSVVEESPAHAS